ncbi:MAG: hypothetical protein ASARMPRED_002611 [Alectoria sarmentosa]|nr:MAG: hypothetical protein ASARMPRED_002611 [Alectoria sarmentosa]
MVYESSSAKRKLPGAGAYVAQIHGLSPADIKLKDARAASNHRLIRKETLVAAKRQFRGLALTQNKRPMIVKVGEFKRFKAVAEEEAQRIRRQGGRYRAIWSSNVKADHRFTPIVGRKVEPSALYYIKASPGKGLGMFAIKDIRQGTRILSEEPFFTLSNRPRVSESDPYAPNDISKAFDRLPASEQRKFMSLHCPKRPGCSLGVSIYEANCFEMGSGTCICLDASRINHSCIPNAHYSWNSSIQRQTLHAVKEISKDEEITISYCSAIRTFEGRKRKLEPYVFTCSCPACQTDTDFGIISQIRRQQMLDLDQEIADYQNDPPAAREEYGQCDERSAILRLVKLIDKEGLVYEKTLAYHDAAECALKRGLRKKALKYASKELEVDLCCNGEDSPCYDETITFFLRIYFGREEALD